MARTEQVAAIAAALNRHELTLWQDPNVRHLPWTWRCRCKGAGGSAINYERANHSFWQHVAEAEVGTLVAPEAFTDRDVASIDARSADAPYSTDHMVSFRMYTAAWRDSLRAIATREEEPQ